MSKKIDLLKVSDPKIGSLYHLSWASNGCVWRLKEIKGEWVKVVTPKTGKERWAKINDLRHTRKQQNKIESSNNISYISKNND